MKVDRSRRPVRVPSQARAKETVERILLAAEEHLTTQGLQGFTTNAIAAGAGVNIATLYSYFPDKAAILQELMVRADEERLAALDSSMGTLASDDWREWIDDGVDILVRYQVENQSAPALRRAALGSPALRALNRDTNRRLASAMARRLRERNPGLSTREAERICEVAVESGIAVLDDACDGDRVDRRKVAELKVLLVGYLAPHLDS